MWTLHVSQRHQQTGISISHLDRSSRRTSFEEKSQAHAYHRQSPPSFSVSSSLLTQALPAPRRLNLSKVLCSGRRRTWWGFAPVAVAGQQPPRRRSRWQRRGRIRRQVCCERRHKGESIPIGRGRIRRQVCCERRHKDESIPIGRGNVELTISFLQWRSRKAGSARSAWRRGEMLN